jgi:glutamyl-tRNA reductase
VNVSDRSREAERAEAILEQEVGRYQRRLQALDVVPTLVDLQTYAEEVRQAELRRAQPRLQSLNPQQLAAVEAVTRGLVNKFLHHPLQALKTAARDGDAAAIEAIRSAFHLSEGSESARVSDPDNGPEGLDNPHPALTRAREEND